MLATPGARTGSVDLHWDATVVVDVPSPLDRCFLDSLRGACADVHAFNRRREIVAAARQLACVTGVRRVAPRPFVGWLRGAVDQERRRASPM